MMLLFVFFMAHPSSVRMQLRMRMSFGLCVCVCYRVFYVSFPDNSDVVCKQLHVFSIAALRKY